MDLRTRLRIAFNLPFPILVGKVTDVFKKRARRRRLRARAATGSTNHAEDAGWSLRSGLMPFPSAGWCEDYQSRILVYVHAYLQHEFDVLGSGVFPSDDASPVRSPLLDPQYRSLDWSYDPTSGHHWPRGAWYEDYGPIHGAEIKQPLEFGRLHQLPQLALAASLDVTMRAECAREIRNQIVDFIVQNPPLYGIQWCSGIDVGIRAFNLCVAWDWLAVQGAAPSDLEPILCSSLVDHAMFLMETLEWAGGMRTSHYLANLLGVLAVGTYLSGHPESSTWRTFAMHALEREIDVQFLKDGSGFEASTCYHRHTADIIEQATVLMGSSASEHWMQRRSQILGVLDILTCDEEIWPIIGDNDDGLALKLIGNEPIPYRFQDIPVSFAPTLVQRLDLGLLFYTRPAYRCALRCGGIGQHGKGGHAHNDQLSLTLKVFGRQIFVDPGIPSYTRSAEERNLYRSAHMHNTLVPNGMEQNEWPRDGGEGLFWMIGDKARARTVNYDEKVWVGQHGGYGMPHRRTVIFEEDAIYGTDEWASSDPSDVLFHCHPDVSITRAENAVWIQHGSVELELSWHDALLRIDDYEYSPKYGSKLLAQCIALQKLGPACTWTLRSFVAS